MIRSISEVPSPYGAVRRGLTVPDDLCLVGLWSALGLALTGVFVAVGFGAEIGQALMAAG
jgi:hypothetical protein